MLASSSNPFQPGACIRPYDFMRCHRVLTRPTCHALNSYNGVLALQAALRVTFATTTRVSSGITSASVDPREDDAGPSAAQFDPSDVDAPSLPRKLRYGEILAEQTGPRAANKVKKTQNQDHRDGAGSPLKSGDDTTNVVQARRGVPLEIIPSGAREPFVKLTRQDRIVHLVDTTSLSKTLDKHRKHNKVAKERRENPTEYRFSSDYSDEHQVQRFINHHGKLPVSKVSYFQYANAGNPEGRISAPVIPRSSKDMHPGMWRPEKQTPQHYQDLIVEHQSPAESARSKSWDHSAMKRRLRIASLTAYQARTLSRAERRKIPKDQYDYPVGAVPFQPTLERHDTHGRNRLNPSWKPDLDHLASHKGEEILAMEIRSFAGWVENDADETLARQAVAAEFRQAIDKSGAADAVTVELFGSEATGLASSTSDIDFVIRRRDVPPEQGKPRKLVRPMNIIYDTLNEDPEWITVVMRKGSHPVITAQHRQSGIDVQLVAAGATDPQAAATRRFLRDISNLKELYLTMRTMLNKRHLGDSFNGGLGSYSTLMMIVAALRRHPHMMSASAAEQLRYIFRFYSTFDTKKYGLCVESGRPYKKHGAHDKLDLVRMSACAAARGDTIRAGQWTIGEVSEMQPWLLSLQDPADPFNDLCKRVAGIKYILRTMEVLHFKVERAIEEFDERAGRPGGFKKYSKILWPVVGDCAISWKQRRDKVRGWIRQKSVADGQSG